MSIKTHHDSFDRTWFITFTCYEWIPLFELFNSYDLVYNWLNLLHTKSLVDTIAFVIMPNHVLVLLHLKNEEVNLNAIVSNGKRFMAMSL
jgi:putative transposase